MLGRKILGVVKDVEAIVSNIICASGKMEAVLV